MIQIDPATAFLIYLGLMLAVILIAWVRHNISRKRREIVPPELSLLHCEYCTHGYIAKKEKKVTRCPQCKSLNNN